RRVTTPKYGRPMPLSWASYSASGRRLAAGTRSSIGPPNWAFSKSTRWPPAGTTTTLRVSAHALLREPLSVVLEPNAFIGHRRQSVHGVLVRGSIGRLASGASGVTPSSDQQSGCASLPSA